MLWSGSPKELSSPPGYRAAAWVCGATSAITTASAFVIATALASRPSGLLAFAAWMATLSLALTYGPRIWRSQLEFVLTPRFVVVRRGRYRRAIERSDVSFARIHWYDKHPGVGDLELVRAVPTGALRRRLSIVLPGLVAPDRVWAILRDITPTAPGGDGHRLLAQRLDEGERVLWSAHPSGGRTWLPTSARAIASVSIAAILAVATSVTSVHAAGSVRAVVAAGLSPTSAAFVALVVSLALTLVLLGSAAVGILYATLVRPARLESRTRYLITDRRVLIQSGDVELHLDRSRIVDVIEAPLQRGARDLFLVLDGPRARAVAASGAFGEAGAQGQGLQPVLRRVIDADAVQHILRPQRSQPRGIPENVATSPS